MVQFSNQELYESLYNRIVIDAKENEDEILLFELKIGIFEDFRVELEGLGLKVEMLDAEEIAEGAVVEFGIL